jgi:hypothetical protein
MRISQRIVPFVDYSIPADYRSEEERLLRARIFIPTLWVLLLLVGLTDIFNFFFSEMSLYNKLTSVGITIPIAAVLIICAFIFKQFSAYQITVNIILFVRLSAISSSIFLSGGPLHRTAAFLLLVPPMFAFLPGRNAAGNMPTSACITTN